MLKSKKLILIIMISCFGIIFSINGANADSSLFEEIKQDKENSEKEIISQISCEELESLGVLTTENWDKLENSGVNIGKLIYTCEQKGMDIDTSLLRMTREILNEIYPNPKSNDSTDVKTNIITKKEGVNRLYRNEKYNFRIKFPEGWTLEDGDGEHVVQKAVKEGSSVGVLVMEEDMTTLSKEELNYLKNFNLDQLSDKDLSEYLSDVGTSLTGVFPGSKLLEKDIKFIDNHKALYYKLSTPYKTLDLEVTGNMDIYQLFYDGKMYQISGLYGIDPIDESANRSVIEQSISTFVIEDWKDGPKETTVAIKNGAKDNLITDLIDVRLKMFIVGIFIVILAGITYLIGMLYSKITGKNIIEKITENGIKVPSRVKRIINFSIDTFIVINGISFLIMYIVIEKANKETTLMMISMQVILYLSIFVIYYILCEKFFGKTIGKFITRTKVIAVDGTKPGFGKVLGRTLLRLVPFEIFSFMGKKPTGWHDRGSDTLVVNLNYKANSKI